MPKSMSKTRPAKQSVDSRKAWEGCAGCFSNAWCDPSPSPTHYLGSQGAWIISAASGSNFGPDLEHIFYGSQSTLKCADDPYLSHDGCTLLEHLLSMVPNLDRQFNVGCRNPITVIVARRRVRSAAGRSPRLCDSTTCPRLVLDANQTPQLLAGNCLRYRSVVIMAIGVTDEHAGIV